MAIITCGVMYCCIYVERMGTIAQRHRAWLVEKTKDEHQSFPLCSSRLKAGHLELHCMTDPAKSAHLKYF